MSGLRIGEGRSMALQQERVGEGVMDREREKGMRDK